MSVVLIGDQRAVFGIAPELPFRMPVHALGFKIRSRAGQFARVFVWYHNRIEEWYLGCENGELFQWIRKGSNRRKRP